MLAEQHAPKALAGEERRRGALDAQAFDHLPPLALELLGRERGLLRQLGDQGEQLAGEFGEAGKGDGAGVRAGAGAEVGAHAPQILLDLAAGALGRAGADDGGGDLREARRLECGDGVAAAEIEDAGEFRNGVRFDQHDFEAVRELVTRAGRPDDGAFGAERGNGSASSGLILVWEWWPSGSAFLRPGGE